MKKGSASAYFNGIDKEGSLFRAYYLSTFSEENS